jgi:hypothetical protein
MVLTDLVEISEHECPLLFDAFDLKHKVWIKIFYVNIGMNDLKLSYELQAYVIKLFSLHNL